MTGPYGDKRLCASFSPEELEKTFWYPGPQTVSEVPSPLSQRRWEDAREVCIECPVFVQCRAENWGQDYGIWGGTDQYERYLYRQRLRKQAAKLDADQREALAKTLAARAGGAEMARAETLARITGYSVPTVRALITEHRKRVSAQRKVRRDATAREAVDVPLAAGISWPEADPPEGDGWLRNEGQIQPGYYLAQSPDGGRVYMKFRPGHMQPVRKWFAADGVSLRTKVVPVVRTPPGGRKAHAA